ncbi:MAG: tetratricopeptide repeat protein, partial [Pseudomonadota bacterium]
MPLSVHRCLVVLALLLPLAACGSPEEREAEYLERGLVRLAEGDFSRARVELRNVLRINPKNARALLAMGQINEQQERYPQAFNAYLAAADADPNLIEAHNAYGVLALTAGQLDAVARAVERIAAVDPDNADGLALQAGLALRNGDVASAEEAARRALARAPAHVNATSALVGVFNARGDSPGAVGIIDEFLAAHGANVPLALLKIQLLAASNDEIGVEEAFGQLIEFEPDNVAFRIALANFYRSQARDAEAETVLRTAVDSLGTSTSAAAALVQLVYATSGLDAAIAEADNLLARSSEDRTLDFLAADLLSREGRIDAARARLQDTVAAVGAETPRGLDARTALAGIDYSEGRLDEARAAVDGVLEEDQQHRGANYLAALIALGDSDPDAALTSARAALARDTNWVPGLTALAQAHFERGEESLTIEVLEQIVNLAPDDLRAAEQLARLLATRGDYDRAMEIWDRVLARVDDPVTALATTAELAIRQGNWSRANRDIARLLDDERGALSGSLLAGSLRVAQGDYEGGREWFNRAGELAPDAAQPMIGVVQSFLAQGDVDGALAAVDARLAEMTDDVDTALVWNLKAQLHGRQGDVQAAADAYRRASAARGDWTAPYLELARLYEGAGEPARAVEVLEEGITTGAAAESLLLERAFVEQRSGRFRDAITTYERLLDAGATNDVVVNNFAALVADFGQEDPARMERALELAGRFETSTEPYFLDTLGWLHFQRGELTLALPLLRRASALLPEDPQLRYHLGAALYRSGEQEQARLQLQRAVVE